MTRNLLITGALLIALMAGLFQAVKTLKSIKPNQTTYARKLRHLKELQRFAPQPELADLLAAADLPPPDSLKQLSAVYLPGQKVVIKESKPETVAGTWQRQRSTLTVKSLPAKDLSYFLQKVENQPNPWRLTGYDLAHAGEAGLKGELTFQSLRAAP